MAVLEKAYVVEVIIPLNDSDISVEYLLKINLEFCDMLSELRFKELSKIGFSRTVNVTDSLGSAG